MCYYDHQKNIVIFLWVLNKKKIESFQQCLMQPLLKCLINVINIFIYMYIPGISDQITDAEEACRSSEISINLIIIIVFS